MERAVWRGESTDHARWREEPAEYTQGRGESTALVKWRGESADYTQGRGKTTDHAQWSNTISQQSSSNVAQETFNSLVSKI